MRGNHKRRTRHFRLGIAALAIASLPAAVMAADAAGTTGTATAATWATTNAGAGTISERQQYVLRLMMQVYDGHRDVSQTQVLGVARVRQGDRSFTQFDFGDGGVVLTDNNGRLAASRFANLSPTEKAVIYDYRTGMMYGDDAIGTFHNGVVQPLLGHSPALGSNASWTTQVPLRNVGVATAAGQTVRVELSRTYFQHKGKAMVLVHYAVPAFSYTDIAGRQVVHWGEGVSLTDPGFGMVYLNSALHRSVARSDDGSVPYRFARTIVAANPDGSAMVDYRDVPELTPYIDRLFSPEAMRVVPTGTVSSSSAPLTVGQTLDLVALSLAEDGGNEVPMAAAAQLSADRGQEVMTAQSAEQLMVAMEDSAAARAEAGVLSPNETVHGGSQVDGLSKEVIEQSNEAVKQLEQARKGEGGQGGTEGSLLDEVTPEAIKQVEQSRKSGSGLRGSLPVSSDSTAVFGGEGEENPYFDSYGLTGSDGSLAQSQFWLDKANAIVGGAANVSANNRSEEVLNLANDVYMESRNISSQVESLTDFIEATEQSLRTRGKKILEVTPEVQALQRGYEASATRLGAAEGLYENLIFQRAELTKSGQAVPETLEAALDVAEADLTAARQGMKQSENALEVGIEHGRIAATFDMADPQTARMVTQLGDAYRRLGEKSEALLGLQKKATAIGKLMDSFPAQQAADFLKKVADSPAGKVLDGLSHMLNVYTTGKAGYNVYTAATNDLSTGQLNLSRDYSSAMSQVMTNGLDLLALTGNALSGNAVGVYSDAVAVVTGSISDLYVANKAWNDWQLAAPTYHAELMKTMRARTAQLQEVERRKLAELKATEFGLYTSKPANDGGVTDPNWKDPRIDPKTGLPKPGYWAYLKSKSPGTLASFGIDPEAPVGGWPGGVGPEFRPQGPNAKNTQKVPTHKPTIDEEPSYPTASKTIPTVKPATQATTTPESSILSDVEIAAIEREKKRQKAQAELEAYQAKKLAERANQPRKQRGAPLQISALEVSELVVSSFDIDPVTFDPVVFDPVTWTPPHFDPPEWVPPQFDPPEISRFPATDPKDMDGYPGTGVYPAFTFANLSGRVETNLDRWAEWLATQDVARLEKLARQAGYPNLASALADASNLMQQAENTGYRQWAMAAPSCSGLVGCGPQYLERWAAKRSRLALGDILASDREFFSSAGLTDVQIAGLMLAFAIADFGTQDGDIVNVAVHQFGQTLLNQTLTTTNAGTQFSVPVNPGVVSVQMRALNEGSLPPNTAGLTLLGVSGGNSEQQYSLNEGDVAGLRVTVGK